MPAVFVIGFPLAGRPFYTAPRGGGGAAQSFDLLFRGVEITTGGQRLHRRDALEAALRGRGLNPLHLRATSECLTWGCRRMAGSPSVWSG